MKTINKNKETQFIPIYALTPEELRNIEDMVSFTFDCRYPAKKAYIINNHYWFQVRTKDNRPVYRTNTFDVMWKSLWLAYDIEPITLWTNKRDKTLILEPFSELPFSHILISETDFEHIYHRIPLLEKSQRRSFEIKCILIADYLCTLLNLHYNTPLHKQYESCRK